MSTKKNRPDSPTTASAQLPESRDYQRELLKESTERNVIITLPTGTGKTHIAILRIKHQLELDDKKLCWFLCPTVALAEQQQRIISAVVSKVALISGFLEPEKWTSPALWKGIVSTHNVVVSTPQILLDALIHGFVHLDRDLGLLVFDEAHHCMLDHPYNRIMNSFYHYLSKNQRPAVLGLTATPVFKRDVEVDMRTLEQHLDAVILIPRLHKDQLSLFTFNPIIRYVAFRKPWNMFSPPPLPPNYDALKTETDSLEIENDPWVRSMRQRLLNLRASDGGRPYLDQIAIEQMLAKTIRKQDTYTHRNLRSFLRTAQEIHWDLGTWAVEKYIEAALSTAIQQSCRPDSSIGTWPQDEREYMMSYVMAIQDQIQSHPGLDTQGSVTPKIEVLISTLLSEKQECEASGGVFVGMLFVTRRDMVYVLSDIISSHPLTAPHFRCGCLVGASSNIARQSVFDLHLNHPIGNHQIVLDKFRLGEIDLLIATSVAEEGLDIQACGTVIRFDLPPNVRSWVQSQGRARQERSTFVVMVNEDLIYKFSDWEVLKQRVDQQCQEERRQMLVDDEINDETDLDDDEQEDFIVQETGARLSLTAAIGHLQHFCSTLPLSSYVNHAVEYTYDPVQKYILFDKGSAALDPPVGPFKATVRLPAVLPPHLRRFTTSERYPSKTQAKRRVAFEAYVTLYKAGLLNKHLLPFQFSFEEDQASIDLLSKAVEQMDAMARVSAPINPWSPREERETSSNWHNCLIEVGGITVLHLYCRSDFLAALSIDGICVYDFDGTRRQVKIKYLGVLAEESIDLLSMKMFTRALFWSRWGSRMRWDQLDFSYLLYPESQEDEYLDIGKLERDGLTIGALECIQSGYLTKGTLLGRSLDGTRYLIHRVISRPASEDELAFFAKKYVYQGLTSFEPPFLEARYLPRRSNFSVKASNDTRRAKELETHLLLPSYVQIDRLFPPLLQMSFLLPSVIEQMSHLMTAEALRRTILQGPSISNMPLHLIVEAISAPSAGAEQDYERLETLGDTCLKLVTSLTLLAKHQYWHEGYLSYAKDHIVSNARLARAAIELDLAPFIIRQPFLGRRWIPLVQEDSATSDEQTLSRPLSTKTLADVVEALLGACYLHAHFAGLIQLLKIFLGTIDVEWAVPDVCARAIFSMTKEISYYPRQLADIEKMINYKFRNKTHLLEAITHASYHQTGEGVVSYERMEFLGDAVLDFITTSYFHSATPSDFRPGQLHYCKIASVNADLLAFLCLGVDIDDHTTFVTITEDGARPQLQLSTNYLWKHLLHSSLIILDEQAAAVTRYNRVKYQILQTLQKGSVYPWGMLSGLLLPKFFSDMIESLLGAIYLDSGGSFEESKRFLTRIGLMQLLPRFVDGSIDLRHPISRVGEWAAAGEVSYGYLYEKGGGRQRCVLVANQEKIAQVEIFGKGRAVQSALKVMCSEAALEVIEGSH